MTRSTPPPALRRRPWRFGWAVLAVWTFAGLLGGVQRYLRGGQIGADVSYAWWSAVASHLVLAYLWAVLTPLCMRLARRISIDRTPVIHLIPIHLLAGAGVALLHTVLSNVIYKFALAPDVTWSEFLANFAHSAVVTGPTRVATYLEIVGVTWGFDSYRAFRERDIRASLLQTQLAEARLDALRVQLRPVFLFNTLNTIRRLIYRDPPAAARTVVQLGSLLRLSLKSAAIRLVTLKEELASLELYLQIERTRLQDRLCVSFVIEPEALRAAVPNLLLQPLLEGAIGEARTARAGPEAIEVRGFRREGMLELEISETGIERQTDPGLPAEENSALGRTLCQLEHLYPGAYRCARFPVWGEGASHGHKVTVAIPFARLGEEESGPSPEELPWPSNALPARATGKG